VPTAERASTRTIENNTHSEICGAYWVRDGSTQRQSVKACSEAYLALPMSNVSYEPVPPASLESYSGAVQNLTYGLMAIGALLAVNF
jgi:hypothetical protein